MHNIYTINHRTVSTVTESRKLRFPSAQRRYRPASSEVGDDSRILFGAVVHTFLVLTPSKTIESRAFVDTVHGDVQL